MIEQQQPVEARPAPPLATEEIARHIQLLQEQPEGYYSNRYRSEALQQLKDLSRAITISDELAASVLPEVPVTCQYLKPLQAIRSVMKLHGVSLYVPGHGTDVSHIEAFPDAQRIINLDVEPLSVAMLRRWCASDTAVESRLGLAENFVPDRPVDLVILLSAAFNKQILPYEKILKPEGLVITNFAALRDPEMIPVCSVQDGEFYFGNQINEHDLQVSSDTELLKSAPTPRFANYASVSAIVYHLTGQTTDLVARYQDLRTIAVEEKLLEFEQHYNSEERRRRAAAARIPYEALTDTDRAAVREAYHERTLELTRGDKTYVLKPLPTISATADHLLVYRYEPLLRWD